MNGVEVELAAPSSFSTTGRVSSSSGSTSTPPGAAAIRTSRPPTTRCSAPSCQRFARSGPNDAEALGRELEAVRLRKAQQQRFRTLPGAATAPPTVYDGRRPPSGFRRAVSIPSLRIPLPRALVLAALAVLALAVAATRQTAVAADDLDRRRRTGLVARRQDDRLREPRRQDTGRSTPCSAAGGGRRALTSGALDSIDVAWSPNGKQLAFSRVAGRPGDHRRPRLRHERGRRQRGSASRTAAAGYDELFDWSPDGKLLSFDRHHRRPRRRSTWSARTAAGRTQLTPSAGRRRLLGRLVARRHEDRLRPHRARARSATSG